MTIRENVMKKKCAFWCEDFSRLTVKKLPTRPPPVVVQAENKTTSPNQLAILWRHLTTEISRVGIQIRFNQI